MTRTPEGDAAAGVVPEIRERLGTWILGDRLPCGCWMATATVDGAATFVVEPCALDCPFYVYARDESKAQGNAVTLRYLP